MPTKSGKSARARFWWASLEDDELLDVRLCDLSVRLPRSRIAGRIDRLLDELTDKGLRFRPHTWISSEWFSPDGVPGIAIPFYLTHDRLERLENRMMFQVEGASERECMRILRHEAGHAVCTAYRLHYRADWRRHFGKYSTPYPIAYRPDPSSRRYVQHLERWYAQAHPAEDFAETFAVWLTPRSDWKRRYQQWPAMRKLEYVDALMGEIADTSPRVVSRSHVDPVSELRHTLREHYRRKRRRYADDWPEVYDHDLRKVFSDDLKFAGNETAASFLRRKRKLIREAVTYWTSEHAYAIEQVISDMIDRCRDLKLRLRASERESLNRTILLVTVQTMNFLHSQKHLFAI